MIFLLISAGAALAAETLTLESVLETLSQHPDWEIAEDNVNLAKGKLTQAQSEFTPELTGQVSEYYSKYPRVIQEHSLEWQTSLGPALSLGWEEGRGSFPTYDGRETPTDGELHIQASIPLLDGLWVNGDRTRVQNQDLEVDIQRFNQKRQQIELAYATKIAYWKWASEVQLEQISQENLRLAETRQQNFERKEEVGTLSKLSLVDNAREVQERKQLRMFATQKQQMAAIKLSYYHRDEEGKLISPLTTNQKPISLPLTTLPPVPLYPADAIEARPDLTALELTQQQIQNELRLNTAKKLPTINLQLDSYQPMPNSTTSAEQYVGLKYKHAPLMQKERGKEAELRAKEEILEQYEIKIRNKIEQDITGIQVQLEQLQQQIQEQTQALDYATEALRLENIRFENGGSDLLDLMKRENNLLKTKNSLIKLQADYLAALAAWDRAHGIAYPSLVD